MWNDATEWREWSGREGSRRVARPARLNSAANSLAAALVTRPRADSLTFSRALTEGLTAQQSDAEFTQMLGTSIQAIFDASNT